MIEFFVGWFMGFWFEFSRSMTVAQQTNNEEADTFKLAKPSSTRSTHSVSQLWERIDRQTCSTTNIWGTLTGIPILYGRRYATTLITSFVIAFVSVLCFRPKTLIMAATAAMQWSHLPLAQWRHPFASSEALVVLHPVMRSTSHCRICMVVEIVFDLPAFFVALILLLATTISERPCYD